MKRPQGRLERETLTVRVMIGMYCRDLHKPVDSLCPECVQLLDYALHRIEKCPFGSDKPTCANCAVHCFKPAMRERVRAAMRYAGPRMLLRHPVLALLHLWDGRRKAGEK